eukprot:CAMPEP_0175121838 /NCGR_PEP_ID=MMETSP0087-20121206/1384_1 /TAXON_ID=136419 /ORGANISM="Unknown Unknown, Strain D1" /LENGTH=474 /DNA_ID=CAMNT_0016403411 /DNA_START=157 /DNA_END=1581 /DNA_ORIENTATION=+
MTSACCGEDPHPVHGVVAPDSTIITCGKAADAQQSTKGFVLRTGKPETNSADKFGSKLWSVEVDVAGKKDAVLQCPVSGDAVFALGYKNEARFLARYNFENGQAVWEYQYPSTDASAYVGADISSAGLVVTGTQNCPASQFEGFKSYGRPSGGSAFVHFFSTQDLQAKPSKPTWEVSLPQTTGGVAVTAIPGSTDWLVLTFGGGADEYAHSLFRLDSSGQTKARSSFSGAQYNDVAVLQGRSPPVFAMTGHQRENGGWSGVYTTYSEQTADIKTVSFGNPPGGLYQYKGLPAGDSKLVYTECWGMQATASGGAVIGCGTGIEGCDTITDSALKTKCQQDPRVLWRSLVVEFDSSMNASWYRTESFVEAGETKAGASASEHVAFFPDGSILSVNDMGFGIGMLQIGKPAPAPTTGAGDSPTAPTPNGNPPTAPTANGNSPTTAGGSPTVAGASSAGIVLPGMVNLVLYLLTAFLQ